MKDSKKKETSTMRAGFTLVELVVVIAILGILAGVAYPAYTGYIKRAQDAKIVSKLSEVVVAVDSAMAIEGETADVTKITVDSTGKIDVTAETTTPPVDLESVYASMIKLNENTFIAEGTGVKIKGFAPEGTSYAQGATWSLNEDTAKKLEAQKWTPGVVQ